MDSNYADSSYTGSSCVYFKEIIMNTDTSEKTSRIKSLVDDWSADKQTFDVPWGKLMMWIFLLSDTFIFSIFLTSYMSIRMTTTAAWPPTSEVFSLVIAGQHVPLLLIAIMTFILKLQPIPTNLH